MSEQLTLDTALQAQTPEGLYPAAAAWLADNPEAERLMVAWGAVDFAKGRYSSMQLFMELLRRPEFKPVGFIRTDAVYEINHNIRSEVERLLMARHECVRFRIRDASCDPPATPQATPRRPFS